MSHDKRHRRAIRINALARSGWTILSETGAGAATHPAIPGSVSITEALAITRRGLLAVERPTVHLSAPWPAKEIR